MRQDPLTVAIPKYLGPIHLPSNKNQTGMVRFNSSFVVNATTSGGGTIDLVFGNTPTAIGNWTTFQGIFNEYRILGFEVEYVPYKNVATWSYGSAISVVDHDASASLGSQTVALNHESALKHTMYQNWRRSARAEGVEEFDWIPTASPTAQYYVKVYSTGNSTIQTIGQFFVTIMIELRGLY